MSSISLLREKFVLRDMNDEFMGITALGNRLSIPVQGSSIPIIIRGHSMHATLRFGAELLNHMSYVSHIENVETFFKWDELWSKVINPFEKDNTSETWIAAYHSGKLIFSDAFHHQFFDVIEQCEFKGSKQKNGDNQPIIMAQNAFKKMGKDILIEQESHVGFILDDGDDELRFAVILRVPGQKATFITRMYQNEKVEKTPYPFIAMRLAADYIEGINMAVRMGFMEDEKNNSRIVNILGKRLTSLKLSIEQAERQYDVKYRPERPNFKEIQKLAGKK